MKMKAMRKRLLSGVWLSAACLTLWAQTAPVADILDVQFNADGSAVDVSPMKNTVEYIGDGTLIDNNSYFGCNVPIFNNPWAGNCTGYYRFNFEGNEDVLAKLADGHSLEMLVKPSYEGDIQDVEAKPFSAMQSGGTGFLVSKSTASGAGGKNVFTFLPNVSEANPTKSTWRWATSDIVPRSGIYYHVIGVWNKEEGKAYIYVDGSLRKTVAAPGNYHPATAGSNWFCIGGDANASGGHQAWTGEVVIARVYDKALDAEEADALWKLVEKPEKEANAAAYMEVVSAGRTFIEDNVATQSLTDEYAAALDSLEKAVAGLNPQIPENYRNMARQEISRSLNASADFSEFLEYKDVMFNYGLFRLRGHYTRADSLSRYFRTMMWLQTVPFDLEKVNHLRRTMLMAQAMVNNKELKEAYLKISEPITYLMGTPDNLSIMQVYEQMFPTPTPIEKYMKRKDLLSWLYAKLMDIGNKQIRIRPKFERTAHYKINLLPQRYMPDAEVLQEMVDNDSQKSLRKAPKGLDFFAALGCTAAERILIDELKEDQRWDKYQSNLQRMKERMGEIDWNQTVSTQWMETLGTMVGTGEGRQMADKL